MAQIVEVDWLDAGCEIGNIPLEAVRELTPMPRKNVGYLVVDDKEKIIISSGWLGDNEHNTEAYENNLVIPAGMVVSIKRLVDSLH